MPTLWAHSLSFTKRCGRFQLAFHKPHIDSSVVEINMTELYLHTLREGPNDLPDLVLPARRYGTKEMSSICGSAGSAQPQNLLFLHTRDTA